MRLIFIRHAEPDYEHNCLTEKGEREAKILAGRVKNWPVRDLFVSPIPRAQMTADPCLAALGREAVMLPWLEEFHYYCIDATTVRKHVPWDLVPEFFTRIPEMYDKEKWMETEYYRSNPDLVPGYHKLCGQVDEFLAGYGYIRDGEMYRCLPMTEGDEEENIVMFCHFGITNFILSHLIGISPALLCMHFVSLPTGITIVNAEKRLHDYAHWRIQVYGDVAHLREAGEPASYYASFAPPFRL